MLAWSSRDEYTADLRFLEQKIWPEVKDKQIAHDSYCCDRYPNTKPYPTRRFKTYQHVGQVIHHFPLDGCSVELLLTRLDALDSSIKYFDVRSVLTYTVTFPERSNAPLCAA